MSRCGLLLLLGGLLAVGGCRPSRLPPADVAAEVGDRRILYSDFESFVETSVGEDAASLDSEVLSRLLDRFLEERMVALLARERGFGGDRRRAIESLLESEAPREPPPAAIEAYYRGHQEEFRRSARVRVRQILVPDRATADRAAAEIAGGKPFEEVAKEVSTDPTAPDGGDQGYLRIEDLPPVFASVLEALAPGEVSAVVTADYGFHLFQVVERQEEGLIPLAEAETEIRDRLAREGADALWERLVAEARDRYDARIHVRNLPFDYHPPTAR